MYKLICSLFQVSLEFNVNETSPANRVSLRVSADIGSKVNILAVDKSVLHLKSGNDVSDDDVSVLECIR